MSKNTFYRLFAIILLLFAAFGAFYFYNVNSYTTSYETAENEQITLRVANGLQITMAENATFRVDSVGEGFGYLSFSGKIYVQIDDDNPFLWRISTNYGLVVAKNAEFLLRDTGDQLETIVATGELTLYRVMGKSEKDGLNVASGEIASLRKSGGGIRKRVNRDKNFLSWKTKVFAFEADRLSEVARVLTEAYQFQVNLSSDALGQCLFTGSFHQQSLDEIIATIGQRFNLTFEKNDLEYMLEGRGC